MIPIVDLVAQYRLLKADIDAAIEAVLRDGKYVLGPAVESFERDFAEYCGTSHAVGTNSGTSALHVALLAAGVRPGDEVITVPFTFIATVAAIDTHCALYVPPCTTPPVAKRSRRSARPASAATGKPLAIALPKVARSGVTSNRSWAPPAARRKPVMTSSKMRIVPNRVHASRAPSR